PESGAPYRRVIHHDSGGQAGAVPVRPPSADFGGSGVKLGGTRHQQELSSRCSVDAIESTAHPPPTDSSVVIAQPGTPSSMRVGASLQTSRSPSTDRSMSVVTPPWATTMSVPKAYTPAMSASALRKRDAAWREESPERGT